MPTTDHARHLAAQRADEADRLALAAWPSRDLDRRSSGLDGPSTIATDAPVADGGAAAMHEATAVTATEDAAIVAEAGATEATGATEMTDTAAATAEPTTSTNATGAVSTAAMTPDATTTRADTLTPPRRATAFLADLTRAMRVAAEEEREDVLVRFHSDAEAFIEQMRADFAAADERARERADQDVAAVEAWCAAELERIRHETEQGIEARRARLEAELVAQSTRLDEGVAHVAATVATFEREMATFFEDLLVEEDPSTFAVMARQLPDPPAFAVWPADVAEMPASAPQALVEPTGAEAVTGVLDPEALAAAEAEAAEAMAMEGFDVSASGGAATAAVAATPSAPARMSVAAVGLVSVASVSAFKRVLSRVDGVQAVQVSSGPQGEFIFTLTCRADLDLAAAVCALPGFDVELRASGDTSVSVVAHDHDQTE